MRPRSSFRHRQDRAARIEWLRERLSAQKPSARGVEKRINSTDLDSRMMKTPHRYIQGYNAQLAVTENHFIVAADLTSEAADVGHLEPMIEETQDNLERTGASKVATIVANAGYLSADNVSLDVDVELLIAPTSRADLDDAIENRQEIEKDIGRYPPSRAPHDDERRKNVMEAYVARPSRPASCPGCSRYVDLLRGVASA
jgi:hypothetical protein